MILTVTVEWCLVLMVLIITYKNYYRVNKELNALMESAQVQDKGGVERISSALN